jgi:hypothetical protein
MLHHEQAGKFTHLKPGATFADISPGDESWAFVLQPMGMPVTWEESGVVAASGHKLRAFAGRLDELFAGGVLLDLTALETLIDMGRGDLAGVRLVSTFMRKERETPVEELIDPAFGAEPERNYMTVDQVGLEARVGELEPLAGSRVISRFVNADRKPVGSAFILNENALGGRVAVCPYDLTIGSRTWLLNWHRKRQLTAVVDWLFRGNLPLTVAGGAWPLPIRTDFADRIMVSVMNASLDDWPEVEATVHTTRKVVRVSRLDETGKWIALPASDVTREGERVRFTSRAPLATLDLATFRIEL